MQIASLGPLRCVWHCLNNTATKENCKTKEYYSCQKVSLKENFKKINKSVRMSQARHKAVIYLRAAWGAGVIIEELSNNLR